MTGKPISLDGSLARTEATGYGLIYYTEEMLKANNKTFENQTVVISGSGNVAIYAAIKAQEYGATVVTVSDSSGYIYDPTGVDIALLRKIKEVRRGRLTEYIKEKESAQYFEGSVWDLEITYDIALPCATQNEIDAEKARILCENGAFCISEGANMPSTIDAIKIYLEKGIIYGPAKAANAGGVVTSSLEMTQNSQHEKWTFKKVDSELKKIMISIFNLIKNTSEEYELGTNYLSSVNIASFLRVADAMINQGIV